LTADLVADAAVSCLRFTGNGTSLNLNGRSIRGAVLGNDLAVGTLSAGCTPDMVKSGPTCIDKYEASVWYVPSALTQLIQQIKLGTVTAADLGADWVPAPVQVGIAPGDLANLGCPDTGSGAGCKDVYAVSIPGVMPAWTITWFQAVAAARNSGKRLPTNAEWQAAALGTPDGWQGGNPPPCNVASYGLANTGSAAGCISHAGAFDMVGNISEWVAEWVPRSTTCGLWGGSNLNLQCLAGAATAGPPGALTRGGSWFENPGIAGVFAVNGFNAPSLPEIHTGFRGAR
jgi:hypothetical protein